MFGSWLTSNGAVFASSVADGYMYRDLSDYGNEEYEHTPDMSFKGVRINNLNIIKKRRHTTFTEICRRKINLIKTS